jgi:hypothetical protein
VEILYLVPLLQQVEDTVLLILPLVEMVVQGVVAQVTDQHLTEAEILLQQRQAKEIMVVRIL